MPFPFFAHQAAVLPFKLRWPRLSGTGLVLGSMAPDFGYFLVGASAPRDWHRPHGVVLYCLPVAMVLFLFLTRFLAAPVACHLPRVGGFRTGQLAYLEAQPRTLPHLAMVAACIVAGGGTHLAWDLFTHSGTWMGDYIPWLVDPVTRVRGRAIHGTDVLWMASTIVGGLFSLLVLRAALARSLLCRWAEERQAGSTAGIDPERRPATSHLAFWGPVVAITLGAALAVYVFRPPGFYALDKATWVLVFLRSSVPGFIALVVSAWRERRAWRHRSGDAGRTTGGRTMEPAA